MKFLYRILVFCLERYRDTHLAKKPKNLTEKTPRERDCHRKADRQRGKKDVTKLYKHIQTYLCRDEEKERERVCAWGWLSVWPDDGIKSCLISPKLPKKYPQTFYIKVTLFETAKEVTKIFGLLLLDNFYGIIFFKRTQSGHTVGYLSPALEAA